MFVQKNTTIENQNDCVEVILADKYLKKFDNKKSVNASFTDYVKETIDDSKLLSVQIYH